MAARACGPRKSEMAALNLSATRPLVLGTSAQIGAPFTAIKEAEGQTDANALTQRFSGFAIQLWDRLVGFRDFFALVRARASLLHKTHPPKHLHALVADSFSSSTRSTLPSSRA